VVVWRICSRKHAETAFSGKGAYQEGGRWNPPGYYVAYTSESLSLAALEFFANLELEDSGLPLVAVSADVPETVRVVSLDEKDLPADWRAYPAPPSTKLLGTRWAQRGESAVLSVPSALIPRERNYLLNPAHPQFRKIVAGKPERFAFDTRMWKGR
jgi:RES domain-containing protein